MNLRVFYLTRRGISDGYIEAPVTKAEMLLMLFISDEYKMAEEQRITL